MADLRKKPDTQRETISQMWYALIGTNGEGLLEQFQKLKEEFEEHRRQSLPGKKPRRLEVLTVVIAIIVGLQSIGLLDGIKAAITRWLTGGGS